MARKIVIDTGPCVALFDNSDAHHNEALKFIQSFRGEMITSRTVVTEVMFLLEFRLGAQQGFLNWLELGQVSLVEPEDYQRVSELMAKYSDLPMDFADGVLVALCEQLEIKHIATLDSDFSIYRYKGRGNFINVMSQV